MLITSNSNKIFSKPNSHQQISSFHNEPIDTMCSYSKIQSLIISNNLNKLEHALNEGKSPNCKNNKGETLLFLCYNLENIDAFKILLKYKVDCNIQRNDGNTILHLAINDNKENFVNILLDNKADPNLINKTNNQTPFHLAIINKVNESILNKLKENGANRNIKDKFHKTPYDYAIETKDNNYILLFNKIFDEKDIILIDKDSLNKSKDKLYLNPNKFKYLPKHKNKRNIIIKDNNENVDYSNYNLDSNTNTNTMSEIYSTKEYNISSKNRISTIQDTIKEIKINELKDFSLSNSNYKKMKSENKNDNLNESNSFKNEYERKCQTLAECDTKEIMKKIILDTVKKLNNSEIIQKHSEKKYYTKNNLFSEKSNENDINNNSATFKNPEKINTLNITNTNNIVSGTSSIIDEKDSSSNNNYKKNFNKLTNNIIILKDDSSYNSNFDSITGSIKYTQDKNKTSDKSFPNMKYMIMKQIKEKNKKDELGSPIYISNKILSNLRNWLISCDLLCYYNLFVEKQFVNIETIINNIKEKKIKLNIKFAEDIGIRKPGHIIRFLLKLQIDSGIFDKNLYDSIIEKYCNYNINNTFILNSSENSCKCCGMSCMRQEPTDSCDFNEFTSYINNNDIFAFLRSKNLFEFKDNFIHNGFDQVDFIIIQLFSEFKFNKDLLTEFLHIYHEFEQKKLIKILYEEKEKICKEINIPFNKKELEDILSELKGDDDSFEEKDEQCFIF